MKQRLTVLCALICGVIATAAPATKKVSPEAKATYDDIKKTLGIVPRFIQRFPETGVKGAWETVKSLEFGETAIPAKYKTLISVAVGAQVPCHYCVLFDTEAAKINGATEAELNETIALSGIVRQWSTVLNGMQIDESNFKKEVARMLDPNRKTASTTAETTGTTAEWAYRDMTQTVGFVPEFMKAFPEEAIAGAWTEFKTIQGSTKTLVPAKYKELIGLALSAQIPCKYCTHYHTEAAKSLGATDREIREAVALSAVTRHWSTVFHGMQLDEKQFKQEVTQTMAFLKRANKTAAGSRERASAFGDIEQN